MLKAPGRQAGLTAFSDPLWQRNSIFCPEKRDKGRFEPVLTFMGMTAAEPIAMGQAVFYVLRMIVVPEILKELDKGNGSPARSLNRRNVNQAPGCQSGDYP
jgi:hypothetical protein